MGSGQRPEEHSGGRPPASDRSSSANVSSRRENTNASRSPGLPLGRASGRRAGASFPLKALDIHAWCGRPEKASQRGEKPQALGKRAEWASQSRVPWGRMGRWQPSRGTLGLARPRLLALTRTWLSPR